MKNEKKTKIQFVREKLNKKTKRKESFDSDEEEREDKQYISNKINIKFN